MKKSLALGTFSVLAACSDPAPQSEILPEEPAPVTQELYPEGMSELVIFAEKVKTGDAVKTVVEDDNYLTPFRYALNKEFNSRPRLRVDGLGPVHGVRGIYDSLLKSLEIASGELPVSSGEVDLEEPGLLPKDISGLLINILKEPEELIAYCEKLCAKVLDNTPKEQVLRLKIQLDKALELHLLAEMQEFKELNSIIDFAEKRRDLISHNDVEIKKYWERKKVIQDEIITPAETNLLKYGNEFLSFEADFRTFRSVYRNFSKDPKTWGECLRLLQRFVNISLQR